MPAFFSLRAIPNPFVFVGTTISDLFLWPVPPDVFANRQMKSAWTLLVIHILLPLIT